MTDLSVTDRPDAPPADDVTAEIVSAAALYDPRARELEAAKRLWVAIETEVRRGALEPGEELTDADRLAIQDTFDGATTLDTLIRQLLLDNLDLETIAPGIDQVMAKLAGRKDRAAKRMAWNKELIELAMVTAGWTTKEQAFECDIGRVNTRPATATVEVIEESKVPVKWWKRGDPAITKKELNAHVLGRYKALNKAFEIRDQSEREQAMAKVLEDFGPEVPGVRVKVDGYTTTIKYS